jgi:hypothetical protein
VLGAVASGYHGADRDCWLRPVMRKMDYYTICYTSTVLRRAAHISLPGAVKAAALLVAPFKPSIVTGLNLALVEVRIDQLLAALSFAPLQLPRPFPVFCFMWLQLADCVSLLAAWLMCA